MFLLDESHTKEKELAIIFSESSNLNLYIVFSLLLKLYVLNLFKKSFILKSSFVIKIPFSIDVLYFILSFENQ